MSSGWSSPQGLLLSRVGLGLVGWLIPSELVDEVLVATERVEQRWRALPSRLGVYVVLALCLLRTKPYGSVVLRAMIPVGVLFGLRAVGWGVPCTKALSKLRDRIGALPVSDAPRIFRTAFLCLFHAASCPFRNSLWTSSGVL